MKTNRRAEIFGVYQTRLSELMLFQIVQETLSFFFKFSAVLLCTLPTSSSSFNMLEQVKPAERERQRREEKRQIRLEFLYDLFRL